MLKIYKNGCAKIQYIVGHVNKIFRYNVLYKTSKPLIIFGHALKDKKGLKIR
jgi:hypothetical protein